MAPLGAATRKDLYRQMENAMPLVFLDAQADADGAFVGTDNDFSMGLMVDYLLRSGAPPSYFDMPSVNQNASERRKAYESSMLSAGPNLSSSTFPLSSGTSSAWLLRGRGFSKPTLRLAEQFYAPMIASRSA